VNESHEREDARAWQDMRAAGKSHYALFTLILAERFLAEKWEKPRQFKSTFSHSSALNLSANKFFKVFSARTFF
jgi:hypothetical protein